MPPQEPKIPSFTFELKKLILLKSCHNENESPGIHNKN
jgi:hypothetical protein